jgi:penicillin-binding protein 1C
MLDGRVVSHGASGHPFNLVLAQDGRYTLTVMDAQGRHDSVVFEIAGVTP